MKKISLISTMATAAILFLLTGSSCTTENGKTVAQAKEPLNISVYLDLSDRLTRELTPSQAERDTAIINHLIDIFVNEAG